MVAAKCFTRKGCPSPLVAEALAALLAIQLCKEMGLSQVHFEGDSKSVVDTMNHGEEDWSLSGDCVRGP